MSRLSLHILDAIDADDPLTPDERHALADEARRDLRLARAQLIYFGLLTPGDAEAEEHAA